MSDLLTGMSGNGSDMPVVFFDFPFLNDSMSQHTIPPVPTISGTSQRTVGLIVAGHTAYVRPVIAAVRHQLDSLRAVLQSTDFRVLGTNRCVQWFRLVSGNRDADGAHWHVLHGRPRFILPRARWFAFPAGLVPRVRNIFESLGHHVDYYHCPPPSRNPLGLNAELLQFAVGDDHQLLQRVKRVPRALIRIWSTEQAIANSVLIARLFQSAKIAVAVATLREAERFRDALRERLGEPVGIIDSQHFQDANRITVVTFHVLQHMAFDTADVVIIPQALDAIGHVPSRGLANLATQRVYGLLHTNAELHTNDEMILTSFIGPDIFQVSQDRQQAALDVVLCPAPPIMCPRRLTGLEKKRQLIWQNQTRNEFVAALAYACASGDCTRCRELGIAGMGTTVIIASDVNEQTRIVILVESKEHAHALHRLIPEATIIEKDPGAAGTRLVDPLANLAGLRIRIVTSVAASLTDWPAEVVIRASGDACRHRSSSLPRICSPDDGNDRQLLIDVCDSFDNWERQNRARREAAYDANGWPVR